MEICRGVSPSNEIHENLTKSLLKTKACMSSVRGTSKTRTPVMTALVVLPNIGDVSLPLVGLDPELVILVAPNCIRSAACEVLRKWGCRSHIQIG